MIVTDGWKLVAERRENDLYPSMMMNSVEDPYELISLSLSGATRCSPDRSRGIGTYETFKTEI
jgi:hypothetical protein